MVCHLDYKLPVPTAITNTNTNFRHNFVAAVTASIQKGESDTLTSSVPKVGQETSRRVESRRRTNGANHNVPVEFGKPVCIYSSPRTNLSGCVDSELHAAARVVGVS